MTDTDKKPKRQRYNAPVGIFVYPKVNTPDTFKDPKTGKVGAPTYKVGVLHKQGDPATDRIVKLIEDAAKAEFDKATEAMVGKKDAKGKPKVVLGPETPIILELDKATGEPTGNVIIRYKMNASYKDKTGKIVDIKPKLYDAKGNETNVEVWGGTEGKVCFEMVPYFMEGTMKAGVSLRLNAIQIIKLRTKGSDGNASMYGFKAEDGFEAMPEMGDSVDAPEVTVDGATNAAKGQF